MFHVVHCNYIIKDKVHSPYNLIETTIKIKSEKNIHIDKKINFYTIIQYLAHHTEDNNHMPNDMALYTPYTQQPFSAHTSHKNHDEVDFSYHTQDMSRSEQPLILSTLYVPI